MDLNNVHNRAFLSFFWQFFQEKPVLSETSKLHHVSQPIIVATASAPPELTPAILGGKPINVLYVTQPEDTVLVRCYPGYEPTLKVRAMGSDPNSSDAQKEGVMICRPPK